MPSEASAGRREKFFDFSLEMLCIAGFDGYFRDLNPRWEEVLGWTVKELCAKPFIEFVHPDDRARTLAEAEKLAATGADTISFENRYRCKDGSYKWLAWTTRSSIDEGILYAAARDIDERKRAEAALLASESAIRSSETRLRMIVDAALNSIITMNEDGLISGWNAQAERTFGWPASEVIGSELANTIVPEQHRKAHRAGLAHFLATGEGPVLGTVIEIEALRRDGTQFPVELSISPPQDDHGELAFVAFVRDITERKEAMRLREEYARELERSNAEFAQFASVASHDLQEPLRMVTSYVQLLERRYGGKLGEDADEYIAFAVDGASRMQALISDLLALSRVGRQSDEPQYADAGECLAVAEQNLAAAIGEAGAQVTSTELPHVRSDPTQLSQVFQNLIGNAIKFRGDRPPVVNVSATREDGLWSFSVSDNGIGISPDQCDRVFEVFQRLHNREEYPGTGIGLAICKKVVERGGGGIWVESQPGQGSTFRFTLPFIEYGG